LQGHGQAMNRLTADTRVAIAAKARSDNALAAVASPSTVSRDLTGRLREELVAIGGQAPAVELVGSAPLGPALEGVTLTAKWREPASLAPVGLTTASLQPFRVQKLRIANLGDGLVTTEATIAAIALNDGRAAKP
jgi:hypothetical protein